MHNKNKHGSSGIKGGEGDGKATRGSPRSDGVDTPRASTSSRAVLVDDVQQAPQSARLAGKDDANRPEHFTAAAEPTTSKGSSGLSVATGGGERASMDHQHPHHSEYLPAPPSILDGSGADIQTSTGSINLDDNPDVFEVAFEPTGPLGITFEWAVDTTVWPGDTDNSKCGSISQQPNKEDEAKNAGVGTILQQRQQRIEGGTTSALRQLVDRGSDATDRPHSAGPSAKRRTPRSEFGFSTTPPSPAKGGTAYTSRVLLPASTLPPISPSSLGIATETLPHALCIQSFPALPPEARATDPSKPAADLPSIDVTKPPANVVEKPTLIGPAAGRGVLRPGDILVEVNGKPVAGPAARQAGVTSFQDAVQVVAAAAAVGGSDSSSVDARRAARRIFTFRRARQRPSSSHPLPAPAPVNPLHPVTLALSGEWVRGMSRAAAGAGAETAEKIGQPLGVVVGHGEKGGLQNTTPVSPTKTPSLLRPIVHLKGLGRSLGSTKENMGGLFTLMSSRSNSSVCSDRTDRSGMDGGGAGSRKSKGGRRKIGGGGNSASVPPGGSAAERIKAEARRVDALLEPWVCPRERLVRDILEGDKTLRPLAVHVTNLSYWYQQRRLLGGFRHMHRRAVFDPRTKRWEASVYLLRDRPSDGDIVPTLSPVGVLNTEGQALAQAAKSARERDANPGAVRGPKPRGMTPSTMLQTHLSVLVVSNAFLGLSHADRLALVFLALYDGGLATAAAATTADGGSGAMGSPLSPLSPLSHPFTPPPKGASSRPRTPESLRGGVNEGGFKGSTAISTGNRESRRKIRGAVKASCVGANVEALPVWGGLEGMVGSSLLVDCRTPAQWRAEEFRPTEQELWGTARSGHRTLANHPRVKLGSVKKSLERVIAESKALREAAPKFEPFERFAEEEKEGGRTAAGSAPGSASSTTRNSGGDASPSKLCEGGEGGEGGSGGGGGRANKRRQHPHFFHGLGPNARRLFLEIYAENRSRLLAPSSAASAGDTGPALSAPCDGSVLPNLTPLNNNDDDDDDDNHDSRHSPSQPESPSPRSKRDGRLPRSVRSSVGGSKGGGRGGGGGAADTVRHAAGAFAASGPPPDLDAAIIDNHGALISRIAEAATRVQRARRLGALPRAARRLRCRQRSALAVQRLFRGHLGRMYAAAWKTVSWIAATRLSAAWRRFTARKAFLVLRARARRGATCMQAVFRGHVARRYAAWCAAHYYAARSIQSGARVFIARCRARHAREIRAWRLYGLPALIVIQRVVRGYLARQVFSRRLEEAVHAKIIVPAAGVLQKCWRGSRGRVEAAFRRRMKAAATEIQRHMRGFLRRKWWGTVLWCRLEHAMATSIAAVGRGYIDRELVKYRRAQRYRSFTIKPAAILIQSQWRGYTKRRDLAAHKRRWLAALVIQVVYRGVTFRRQARRRYQAWFVLHKGYSATKIQCSFRRWQARKLYRGRLLEASWRRTIASRIILRSWRSYKLNLKMDELKEQWKVEKAALELATAQKDIKDIHADLELCVGDISAVKKSIKNANGRRKLLVEFRKEAELRLPIVERQIENLTLADMEGGWGENYDREWDMLSNCMSMALEEERIMQVRAAKLEADLQMLRLEIDDQETDMDGAATRVFDRMEALRRMEITRGLGLAARDRTRAVRRERMRWAVRDVRRNVIKRSRKDLERFAQVARATRPLNVEQTISYEKRRDRERDEEAEVRRLERQARKERFAIVKAKGEGSVAMRDVSDAVVSGIRDIIATVSFDARRAKNDYRGRGPDEVAPAISAAATAAAAATRQAVTNANKDLDNNNASLVETAVAAAAAEAAAAAASAGGAEPGGGFVCRACGGPRFGRAVCAKCGANANEWRGGFGEGE